VSEMATYTSAGVTAGIDLVLVSVKEDLGGPIAAKTCTNLHPSQHFAITVGRLIPIAGVALST